MLLRDLLEGLSYELLHGSLDIDIKGIYNDSRNVTSDGLFFCITGALSDGHAYANDVVKKGAKVLIIEKDVSVPSFVTVIKVHSTRYAMGIISSNYYGNPSKKLKVIGITGTKGKTTTAYMIREMLELSGIKTGLIGTIEVMDGVHHIHSANTTPESITLHAYLKDMVDNGLSAVVMEVSSQGLMLDRIAGVKFDYGIFTNLSKDHIGPNEHKTFEEYMMWKAKLFTLCDIGIFNVDDEHVDNMTENASCKVYTYGMEKGTDYGTDSYNLDNRNGVLGIRYELRGKLSGEVKVDLPGEFSVHNSLAAIAVADLMGVSFDDIKKILKEVKIRGRVEMIPISDEFTVMIDYAHNEMALDSLYKALLAYKPDRLISVFGCGGNRSKDRRYDMGKVSGGYADLTIITSDNPRNEDPLDIIHDIIRGIEKTNGKYMEIADRKEAMRYAIMHAKKGDVIVFAGKGHEDYQEINGVKYHMDERDLIKEILEEEDVTKICGYNNRYFA